MHHTAVSGTGAEPGRGGNSRGNRKRGRGRGRGKQVVESSSSTEVQQSAKGRLRKEAPPAEPCSSIASTANATTPGGGPQHPTPTRPGSAPEEIHPQPVGEPENHEDTASFQSFKGPDRQKTASGDSVTIAKSSAAVTDSTGSTSKSSRPPVQVFGALSKNTTGPAAGEGPGRVHSVDEPEYSGHHNNCDGNTVNASPPTRSAKRRNRRKGKAAVKCDDNLSDATVQPNGPNVGHVAPATTSNLEAPEMATIVSSQSTGLNGIGAHAPPMVDTAVGKDIVPPVVAEIIVPLGSALANVNNIPGTGAGRSKRAKRGRGRKNKAEAAASCDDAKTSVHAVGTSGEVNINKCEQHAVPQGSEQGSAPRSQYQHFVPCLVLRAFSTAESRALGGRRGAQVNVYSMKDACITPQPVARCYGYHNMYQDISAADEMHVEKALAVLEGRAAKAIDKVKRAQAKDASSVTLTRTERNNIRKFLFVMLYRRPLFWKKYSFTAENYQLVDRDRVLQFMRKRGFTRPIQVWLHNLKTILDTPIDPKDEWENSILETCFIDDGKWFIQHMNDFFTTFVQPENPENEFIVTDTSFGIHEGPTDTPLVEGGTPEAGNNLEYSFETLQQACGSQVAPAYYTVFHTMAPFSPKLLLVLRSLMLQNEDTKRMLRQAADTSPSPGSDQWKCRSIFDKLHLDIPRANYISPGSHTDGDTFGFTIHKISDQDVWRFNSIFLEHVRQSMTWNSNVALKRTLTEYLDNEKFLRPMSTSFRFGEEEWRKQPGITRREQLYRLLAILEGHQGKGMELPVPPLGSHIAGMLEFEAKTSRNPDSQGYFKLGGKPINLMRDQWQSSLVADMRTAIADVICLPQWTPAFTDAVTRTQFAFYATLPPTVIYLHIVVWQLVQHKRQFGDFDMEQFMEDEAIGKVHRVVANLATKIPRKHLSKLMLQASFRRVAINQCIISGKNDAEYACFKFFGGLTSSFLLESTPLYDASVDAAVLDPYRDEPVSEAEFKRELEVRFRARAMGLVEAKWGPEVDKFVWEWLYSGPSV